MNIPGGWELILVVLVIMVLFGYKRLPDATRSLGRSMRIFKAETKGLREDTTTTTAYAEEPVQAHVPPPSVPPTTATPTSATPTTVTPPVPAPPQHEQRRP